MAFGFLGWMAFALPAAERRINQEGRILGSAPTVAAPTLFNTSYADAVVSAMQIFPTSNPWNECISNRPVLANSDAMIAQINSNVGSSHRKLSLFQEMNFVLVPDNQLPEPIVFFNYPDESDLDGGTGSTGLYPIPGNLPIEGWPTQTGDQTLEQWQTNNDGSDRHSIMVAPESGSIWETWETALVGTNWTASNGAKFNLNSNALRSDGWTSGDAGGLPMFPALVRYDECERGMVEHACRLVVVHTRKAHIYPATHNTSGYTGTNYPAMGQRLRLKSSFAIPANWTKEERALLLGLKKYGAIVADNSSSFFSISIAPDNRWPPNAFSDIASAGVGITNFEVIQTTGANEGPRSPGAPVAVAGPDRVAPLGVPVQLQGFVEFAGASAATLWKVYDGPGAVSFGDPAQTNTTATFSVPGVYTLELSADDGVHAVAYDAVVITLSSAINLSMNCVGRVASLSWTGGSPPFVVERAETMPTGVWCGAATTIVQSVSLALTNQTTFFRVREQ